MSHMNDRQTPPTRQILLVTDRRILDPTLFTLWSLSRHLKGEAEVHFWGNGLTDADWTRVQTIAAATPAITLTPRSLDAEEMRDARALSEAISATAMGRLLAPEVLDGRVLYLDGDLLVRGDISPLFTLDMQGKAIGGVRDFVVARWSARDRQDLQKPRGQVLSKLMGAALPRYINSGVLLMDLPRLRSDAQRLEQFTDIALAGTRDLGDQDHINAVMAGDLLLLNPAWNSSWGRARRVRKFAARLGADPGETETMRDRILHFHGHQKPWLGPRRNPLSTRTAASRAYRREMPRMQAQFPDLNLFGSV